MSKNVKVTVIHGENFDYALRKSYGYILEEARKDEKILAKIREQRLKKQKESVTK